jgi:Ser/Thr protein kinase RdoA (MazF antagonist)
LPATDPDRLELIARDALAAYGLPEQAGLTLLNVSENATFRVDDPDTGGRSVLRVHRPGYHCPEAIRSELAWVQALRADGVVSTPEVLPTVDGSLVATGTHVDGERRNVVRFGWVEGVEPAGARLVDDFQALGAIAARLHRHVRTWRPPAGFTRFRWDYQTSIGPRGHWGRWQDGLGVGPAERAVLGRLDDVLRERLTAFGDGPDRFGLVHADMRLANLLVDPAADGSAAGSANGSAAGDANGVADGSANGVADGSANGVADGSANGVADGSADGPLPSEEPAGGVSVIDFDDCGFSWFLYDLGSSLSFMEHDPAVPTLVDAWVTGYREVAPLSAEEQAELPTFVLLRRLLLVAWIGSHHDTDLARSMGPEFTQVSCDLAEDYLSRFTR